MIIDINRNKFGQMFMYNRCRGCGIIVSTRLRLCPMCHRRIVEEKRK